MALRAVTIVEIDRNLRNTARDQVTADLRRQQNENSQVSNETTDHEFPVEVEEMQSNTNQHDENFDVESQVPESPAVIDAQNYNQNENNRRTELPNAPSRLSSQTSTRTRRSNRVNSSSQRNLFCCKFYKSHYIGQVFSGVFTALVFLILGIVLLINSNTVPIYIGIILIIVSFPPICMAIQRWRYQRMYENEQQRRRERISIIRENRQERQRALDLYPDLPPSYNNLSFQADEYAIEVDTNPVDEESSNEDILPTYEDITKKEHRQSSDSCSEKEDTIENNPDPPSLPSSHGQETECNRSA